MAKLVKYVGKYLLPPVPHPRPFLFFVSFSSLLSPFLSFVFLYPFFLSFFFPSSLSSFFSFFSFLSSFFAFFLPLSGFLEPDPTFLAWMAFGVPPLSQCPFYCKNEMAQPRNFWYNKDLKPWIHHHTDTWCAVGGGIGPLPHVGRGAYWVPCYTGFGYSTSSNSSYELVVIILVVQISWKGGTLGWFS